MCFIGSWALKVGKILHGELGSLDIRSFLLISVLLNTIVGGILGATYQIMIYLEFIWFQEGFKVVVPITGP